MATFAMPENFSQDRAGLEYDPLTNPASFIRYPAVVYLDPDMHDFAMHHYMEYEHQGKFRSLRTSVPSPNDREMLIDPAKEAAGKRDNLPVSHHRHHHGVSQNRPEIHISTTSFRERRVAMVCFAIMVARSVPWMVDVTWITIWSPL